MLVIRRRAGESFFIAEDIEIEVLEIGATQVKLGIAAPKEVSIARKEIYVTGKQNRVASRHITSAELAGLSNQLK
ncbi:MAG TPA: carbon storage regulator [Bryobacteraceae bacterium]|jgi:carbon storage regulator|nr:carbon storage regulator [Bryobacteraceae bacterium]